MGYPYPDFCLCPFLGPYKGPWSLFSWIRAWGLGLRVTGSGSVERGGPKLHSSKSQGSSGASLTLKNLPF